MIDVLLWMTMTSYWTALLFGTIGMLAVRFAASRIAGLTFRKTLAVVLIPLSIGYFLEFPKERPLRNIHRALSILVFVLTLFASVWILYTRYF